MPNYIQITTISYCIKLIFFHDHILNKKEDMYAIFPKTIQNQMTINIEIHFTSTMIM